MSGKVCIFYNLGYCKFQDQCKYKHPKEICTGQCKDRKCNNRHPKSCRYKDHCRRPTTCLYRHEDKSFEYSVIKAKTSTLEAEIEILKNQIEVYKIDIKNVEAENILLKSNLEKQMWL